MSAPTSPWLPTRSAVCPACGTSFALPATGRCGDCDVDLTHPAVTRLLDLEHRRRALADEHATLLAMLVETRSVPPPPPPWARAAAPVPGESPGVVPGVAPGVAVPPPPAPIWQRAAGPDGPPPPAPRAGRARTAPRRRASSPVRHLSVPTVLALAGVALLTTAAVVFTAVTWTTLPSWAQAATLLAATIVAGVAAFALARRGIPTAAAAVGLVTMSFAAVDVVGLDRTAVVDLDGFVVPAAAALAALVGWWFAHRQLRWVATAGALAAVVTAGSLTAAVADRYGLSLVSLALVGLGVSLLLAATIRSWPTQPALLVASGGAVLGVTLAGLVTAAALGGSETALFTGLGVLALAVGALLVAARWTPLTLAPATLLVTAAVAATALELGAQDLQVVAAVGVPVAALAWTLPRLRPVRQLPTMLGLTPAAVVLAGASLLTVEPVVERWVTTIAGDPTELLEPWAAVVVALVGGALVSLPRLRTHVGWVAFAVVAVASAALPSVVAWPLLLALAAGSALSVPPAVRPVLAGRARAAWTRTEVLVPLSLAVIATGWAAGTHGTLAVAAAITAAVCALLARRAEHLRRTAHLRCTAAEAVGVAAAALAVWAAAEAFEVMADLALGAALAVVFALAVSVRMLREEDPPVAGSVVALAATVLLPTSATTPAAAGVLLLVAATGWLVLATRGWGYARWVAALAVSAGIAALLADADVTVVEAYTLAPALTLGGAGIWSLLEDHDLRTGPALTPALTAGLVPSLVLLAGEPQALARTLGLALVAGALAAIGTRLRWLAPTVAGAAAAVVVALTQLSMVVDVAPRWATFAVVGVLLVALAATYERQRSRAHSIADRLGDLR
jgi:hypothetical protein